MFRSGNPTISLFRLLTIMTTVTVFTFVIAVSIALNSHLSSHTVKAFLKDINVQGMFIELIRSEVHALPSKDELPPITDLALNLLINIKPKDVRTFLGNEIPGLALYHTEIVIAGKGTDITTLPIESPPPQFDLLEKTADESDEKKEESTHHTESNKKTVFIYHSHSWEAFKPLLDDKEHNNQSSSANEKVNVIAVGNQLKQQLEKKGIGVEHSKLNASQALTSRNWNYYQSYNLSRETVQEAITNNENLRFLVDIHRDDQPKKVTTATIHQKKYARIFFVVGKEHKNHEKNLEFAKKLNTELEKKYPGISRGVFVKGKSDGNGIYNQDLAERALLLEFGGVDNDLTELQHSVEAFADIFSEYYWGNSEI